MPCFCGKGADCKCAKNMWYPSMPNPGSITICSLCGFPIPPGAASDDSSSGNRNFCRCFSVMDLTVRASIPRADPQTSAAASLWADPQTSAAANSWADPQTSAAANTWADPQTSAAANPWADPQTSAAASLWADPQTSAAAGLWADPQTSAAASLWADPQTSAASSPWADPQTSAAAKPAMQCTVAESEKDSWAPKHRHGCGSSNLYAVPSSENSKNAARWRRGDSLRIVKKLPSSSVNEETLRLREDFKRRVHAAAAEGREDKREEECPILQGGIITDRTKTSKLLDESVNNNRRENDSGDDSDDNSGALQRANLAAPNLQHQAAQEPYSDWQTRVAFLAVRNLNPSYGTHFRPPILPSRRAISRPLTVIPPRAPLGVVPGVPVYEAAAVPGPSQRPMQLCYFPVPPQGEISNPQLRQQHPALAGGCLPGEDTQLGYKEKVLSWIDSNESNVIQSVSDDEELDRQAREPAERHRLVRHRSEPASFGSAADENASNADENSSNADENSSNADQPRQLRPRRKASKKKKDNFKEKK